MDAFRCRLSHYAALPDPVWARLESTPHRLRRFDKQQSVAREHDRLRGVQILEKGMAIRKRQLENGRRQILNFVVPGDIFDLQALIDTESDHAVETITACESRYIARPDFMRAVSDDPTLVSALWWAAIQEEGILREHLVLLGQRNAMERVAHLLIELRRRLIMAGQYRAEDTVSLPITHFQIADALGLSSVHVSRTISKLKRMGLVRSHRKLDILDPETLAAVSGFEDSHLHLAAQPLPDQMTAPFAAQ